MSTTSTGTAKATATAPTWRDTALQFPCQGQTLLGVLSEPVALAAAPAAPAAASTASAASAPEASSAPHGQDLTLGVLVIVGGPQYRAGSHRQFTLLARHLAAHGIPCLRFDHRGLGDSTGQPRSFEQLDDDIAAALQAWQQARPGLQRVLLWGLCDAASAALLYVRRQQDPRIAGLCLLNPWVRTGQSLARAQVRHYYLHRLRQREFWHKLLRGGVGLSALRELLGKVAGLRQAPATPPSGTAEPHYTVQMAQALRGFGRPVLLLLSGDDLVAKEFLDRCRQGDGDWAQALRTPGLQRVDLPGVDHTCSSAAWRAQVQDLTLDFAAAAARGA